MEPHKVIEVSTRGQAFWKFLQKRNMVIDTQHVNDLANHGLLPNVAVSDDGDIGRALRSIDASLCEASGDSQRNIFRASLKRLRGLGCLSVGEKSRGAN